MTGVALFVVCYLLFVKMTPSAREAASGGPNSVSASLLDHSHGEREVHGPRRSDTDRD